MNNIGNQPIALGSIMYRSLQLSDCRFSLLLVLALDYLWGLQRLVESLSRVNRSPNPIQSFDLYKKWWAVPTLQLIFSKSVDVGSVKDS